MIRDHETVQVIADYHDFPLSLDNAIATMLESIGSRWEGKSVELHSVTTTSMNQGLSTMTYVTVVAEILPLE